MTIHDKILKMLQNGGSGKTYILAVKDWSELTEYYGDCGFYIKFMGINFMKAPPLKDTTEGV